MTTSMAYARRMPSIAFALAGSSSTSSTRCLRGDVDGASFCCTDEAGRSIGDDDSGKSDSKSTAAANAAVDLDVAAELSSQPSCDGEAEAKSFSRIAFMVLHLEKFLEQPFAHFRFDANPGI